MKEKIIAYLKGPRPYREGVTLYEIYGLNLMLKATFRRNGETDLLRATLMEELRKLAGLSEAAFKTLQRQAVAPAVFSDVVDAPDKIATSAGNSPVTPVVENVIRFRDRFPFLNSPDCPDILKILVADMFTAYDLYLKSYKELCELPDDAELEQSLSIAKTTVENYLEDRSIWEELEYYRDHHVLLGKHPRIVASLLSDELSEKSDLEVLNIRKNAASNVSKWKKKLESIDDDVEKAKALNTLEKWEARKTAAEQELEVRKKTDVP